MAEIRHPYTQEEVYNNYEFKILKRIFLKEFPWILDVTVDPDNLNRYNTIFLDMSVDPIKASEEFGEPLAPWVKRAWEDGKEFSGLYLNLLFEDSHNPIFRQTTNELRKIMEEIKFTPAIPDELKLKGDRMYNVGNFIVNPGKEPWF